MSDPIPDLLIVGGGLIGMGIADVAARQGLSVTLLERERVGGRASWAGAGMLNCRPWPRTSTPDYHDLILKSVQLHERWAARLLEETDLDVGYRRCGSLELYAPARLDLAGLENLQRLLDGCQARDVKVERLTSSQAQALEPRLDLSTVREVIHLPGDGQVRTPRLARALALSCRQWGVKVQEGVDIADVWLDGTRTAGAVARDCTRHPGGQVVFCTGAWTGQFETLRRLVPRLGRIEPVRGQILCYQTEGPLCTRLITVEHHYMVPRPDGVLLVGSTMERVGFEAVTTPEAQADLRRFAESLLPELRSLAPLQGWADFRPGLKGRHPILGPVPGVTGLLVAAGHFRNGIILTPLTAELIVALVRKEPPLISVEPWLPQPPGAVVSRDKRRASQDHEDED